MVQYTYLQFTGAIASLADSSVRDALRQRFIKADQDNQAIYQQSVAHYAEAIRLAKLVHGDGSRVTNYMRQHPVPAPKRDANQKAFSKLIDQFNDWQRKQNAKAKRDEARREREAREYAEHVKRSKASQKGTQTKYFIRVLSSLGFERGVDFTLKTVRMFYDEHVRWDDELGQHVRVEQEEPQNEVQS